MAHDPVRRSPAIAEGLDDELRRAEQRVGQLVLALLALEHGLVERMLVVGRQRDSEPLALRSHHFEREAGVRVRALEHRRDAESLRLLERGERAQRPGVHEVDLTREPGKPARHDPVVPDQRAQLPDRAIRHSKSATGERGLDRDRVRQCANHGRGVREHLGSRCVQAEDLLPRRVTDPSGTDPVREAVEDAHAVGATGTDLSTPHDPTVAAVSRLDTGRVARCAG